MNEQFDTTVIGSVKPLGGDQEVNVNAEEVLRRFGRVQRLTDDGVPMYGFISSALKEWCDKCLCYVRAEGHAERCRRPSDRPKGWSLDRERAWFGDIVHKADVQLALVLAGKRAKTMVLEHGDYIPNYRMRQYLARIGLEFASDTAAGTYFEANYHGEFRREYLQLTFPEHAEAVLAAWLPVDFVKLLR